MLRRVALVRTDVSEEHSASIIGVTRIGELGLLAITSNWHILWRNAMWEWKHYYGILYEIHKLINYIWNKEELPDQW
jgi:hypothetical protein